MSVAGECLSSLGIMGAPTRVDTKCPEQWTGRPSEHMVASLPVWKGIEQTGFPKIMTEAEQCRWAACTERKLERIFQTEGNAVVKRLKVRNQKTVS